MSNSIYWYDYETFGIDPRFDRLSQFAGIRTDENLEIISEPLTLYCKPADDCLPDPGACLVTGITPQKAQADGVIEAEFIAGIHKEFSMPGTCIAGFNNIRFDDEFTRFTLYRNFYNAYAHEWQNGNSRWDIIDMVRLTRALRPDGINWPEQDGRPSNRLELLTAENNISHESAHDAMSDVYATIAVAKLIREKQPRLYNYVYGMRRKTDVAKLINIHSREPIIHASSRYPAERGALAIVMPVCQHPVNKNSYIVYDLDTAPEEFLEIDVEELAARLYTPSAELPEGVTRVPLKQIHINKCPVIAPLKTLDPEAAKRLAIDLPKCQAHRNLLLDNIDRFVTRVEELFAKSEFTDSGDPDAQLYSGGFFSRDDEQRIATVRNSAQDKLALLHIAFDDSRLEEMLFRYRARNYRNSLTEDESRRWEEYRQARFHDPASSNRTLNQFFAEIDRLRTAPETTGRDLVILDELENWGNSL